MARQLHHRSARLLPATSHLSYAMAPERSPWLPLELWHYILALLRHSPTTLVSCNQVCHAWRSATRAYLFHSLVIESEGKYRRTLRILTDHPHLASYVHELCIVGTTLVAYRAFDELFAVAPSLPRLKKLCLQRWAFFDHDVEPRHLPYSPRGRVLGTCANVRELTLHIVFPRPLDFVQLIRACPNLRALHLSVMLCFNYQKAHSGIAAVPLPENTSLDTLTWRNSSLFPLQWLLRDQPTFSPRAMSLAWNEESAIGEAPYQEEVSAAAAIVQEALLKTGPTLERLELCDDNGQDYETADYGLAHCVCLREIRLEPPYRNRSSRARHLSWIPHAIRQLNSPRLSSIEVGLGCDEYIDSRCASELLASLDDALARLAQHKPGIAIVLLIWTWWDELVDNIIHGLPQLRATGTRFCVRLDAEGMQRACSEVDITSHLASVYDTQPGDPRPMAHTLETVQMQEQVRWYPG